LKSFKKIRQQVLLTAIVCMRAFVSQLAFGVSAFVEDGAGRVLLVRHRFGHGWALPGGGVGANEPPELAILRELAEEVGLAENHPPELFGLYTRRILWATNVIALYRVPGARIAFKPNFEISGIVWADPSAPPPETHASVLLRLAELTGKTQPNGYW